MDKIILVQYCDIMEEIKDIRRRIERLEIEINQISIVSDSVKGTRKDGTYGSIKITGYPTPLYDEKKRILEMNILKLQRKEIELLGLTCQAEEYIESIEKSELRSMLRFSIIENLSNAMVAHKMNEMFPKRAIKYTDENVKKRIQRFFEKK